VEKIEWKVFFAAQ